MSKRRISDYQGKLCVVTGAASGIGRAAAIRLEREGARLVLTDHNAEGLDTATQACREIGAPVLVSEPLDITDHQAVLAFGEQVLSGRGAPDAIFHVAGDARRGRPGLRAQPTA